MNLHTLQFFNPYRDIRHTKNRLPHWQQSGAVYFVTFRLADAISKHLREELEQQRRIWLRYHPEPWTAEVEREYHQRFTGAIERWLDVGYGSCLLRRPACARIVAETLQHFDGQRYSQIAWVVMPNHVHALFSLYEDCLLEKVLHTWKSFTANRINRVVARSGDSLPPGGGWQPPLLLAARLFRPPGKG